MVSQSASLLPCHCTSPSHVSSPPAAPHPHSTCGAAPSPATTECSEANGTGRSSRVGTNGEVVEAAQICTACHRGLPPPCVSSSVTHTLRRCVSSMSPPTPPGLAAVTDRLLQPPTPVASAATRASRRSPKMDSVDSNSMGWDREQRIDEDERKAAMGRVFWNWPKRIENNKEKRKKERKKEREKKKGKYNKLLKR
jgi:hypothetical protein